VRDVEGLAEVLIDSGYARDDVVVMTRKSGVDEFDLLPTAAHVRNQLSLLLKLLKPGDTVLLLLCGHGVLMEASPPGGGKPVPTSFFCPMDADLKDRPVEVHRLRRVLRRPGPEQGIDKAAAGRRLPQRAEGRAAGAAGAGD
jgi:hypothetical protein